MSMQDIDKLVFALVPMTLAGPRARRKLHDIGTKLGEAHNIAQALYASLQAGLVKWRGIARPLAFPRLAAIYLRRDGKVWEVVPARY